MNTNDKQADAEILAMCLDEWGHHQAAASVRKGEDLESYEEDLKLIQQLRRFGVTFPAAPAPAVDNCPACASVTERYCCNCGWTSVEKTQAQAAEAPTGTPPRAWTEQERQDAQDAMRRIVDSGEQAPDVGGDVAACNCPGGSKPLEAHAPNCPARSQRTPTTQGDAINESEVAMDAERYRWLRDKACFGSRHDPAVLKDGPSDCCEFMFGEELDAAIDAAISAQAGGGK